MRLVGSASANDGLFDLGSGEFGDFQLRSGQRGESSATRLAKKQRRAWVHVDEGFLNRRFMRGVGFDNDPELRAKDGETVRHVGFGIRLDNTVGDPGETRAIHSDNAPAGVAKARIDAENSNHLVHSG